MFLCVRDSVYVYVCMRTRAYTYIYLCMSLKKKLEICNFPVNIASLGRLEMLQVISYHGFMQVKIYNHRNSGRSKIQIYALKLWMLFNILKGKNANWQFVHEFLQEWMFQEALNTVLELQKEYCQFVSWGHGDFVMLILS